MGEDFVSQLDSQDRIQADPRGTAVDQSDEDASLAIQIQRNIDCSAGVVDT